MVTSLTVVFNEPVTIDPTGVSVPVAPGKTGTQPSVNLSTSDGGLTYTITFSGAGVNHGSIADGVYRLTIAASAVTDQTGIHPSADITKDFLRLFGDVTGEGNVNNSDLFVMRSAFNTTTGNPSYQSDLDYNADGFINNSDLIQFRSRFNESLSLPANGNSIAASSSPAIQNPTNPDDVNRDGMVTPLDALLVLNAVQAQLSGSVLPAVASNGATLDYDDVNGDGIVTPLDALLVINALNSSSGPAAATALGATIGSTEVSAAMSQSDGSVSAVAETLASQAAYPRRSA